MTETTPSTEVTRRGLTETDLAELYSKQTSLFGDVDLANIDGMQGALDLFSATGVELEDWNDYGTGFVVTDKAALVGVPLVLLEWRFNEGDFGGFVSAAAVTADGRKVVINDGSTGIREQLEMVTAQRRKRNHPHPQAGLKVMAGLTVSEYETEAVNPKTGETVKTRAKTYYLGNA